ncbi:hypothetical protein EWB00_004678 [Schistosoma japonicum]|uniref:Uncharacterized protein n=1 Tax=Schistosoma japonicum TaxID=6182 RepID=A0A4Z2DYF1_SCHJA|nr:hypothetical protein EWB00_004678 [Schistosoma japonicum]
MTYNHVRSKPFMACDPSKEEKRNINTVSSLSTLSDEVIKYVMSVYRKEVISHWTQNKYIAHDFYAATIKINIRLSV